MHPIRVLLDSVFNGAQAVLPIKSEIRLRSIERKNSKAFIDPLKHIVRVCHFELCIPRISSPASNNQGAKESLLVTS